jgi:N-acetylglucosamine-6-phosphate deacetylase
VDYEGITLAGEAIRLSVEHGLITSLTVLDTNEYDSLSLIAPGLIDVQVNGFAGVDYNTLPLDEDEIMRSLGALFKEGVTSFLPTITTNSVDAISELLRRFEKIRSDNPIFNDVVPGYHIEGPFISEVDGPRGAHSLQYVCPPSVDSLNRFREASGNRISIVTMSPEWEDSTTFIRYCVKKGIHVSIGHTAATVQQIRDAAEAGADLSTHLGNGCHLTMDRHDNYIWQQLSEEGLWAGIIGDGFHLPVQVLKVFIKVKGEKIILTSDATSFAGLAPGRYKTHIGGEVILTEKGKLHLAESDKILAGSARSVLFAVNRLVSSMILSISDAWRTASYNPSIFLPLKDRGALSVGKRADFVMLDKEDEDLIPEMTVVNGIVVFQK